MATNADTARWLVVYTKPRWEKKTHQLLLAKRIQSYCPINTVYRKWSDRIKKVEEPLFKSYLFVQVTETEQAAVRLTEGVLNFVYWMGKPAVVKPDEIDNIKRFLNEHDDVEVAPYDRLQPGAKVTVTSGLMMGAEGTVEKLDNKWAEVIIETIGFKLRAKIAQHQLHLKPPANRR
ncbi:MAG TPA: UpxY family transcription antiterminator [Phnomibacter sp.]|nr:UpxY family transcription antiterminator [Phnomibacter sp.]